jgi:hypothetical protein
VTPDHDDDYFRVAIAGILCSERGQGEGNLYRFIAWRSRAPRCIAFSNVLQTSNHGVDRTGHEGSIPGFRAEYWRLLKQRVSVIALSNLQGAALDQTTAWLAMQYASEVKPAYEKRWPSPAR